MLSSAGYAHITHTFPASVWNSYDKTPSATDFDGDMRADPAVYKDHWTIWSVWLSNIGYDIVEGEYGGGGCFSVVALWDADRLGDLWLVIVHPWAHGTSAFSGNYQTHEYPIRLTRKPDPHVATLLRRTGDPAYTTALERLEYFAFIRRLS
jgi:hypothetical protein